MKPTVEIGDLLLRKAKAAAAGRGQSLKQFLHEAVTDKLSRQASVNGADPAWMKFVGTVPRSESKRIMQIISREFGQIEPADWT